MTNSEPDPESQSERKSGRQTKISRILDTYELQKLGSELENYWTAESGKRKSLRELAEFVNKQIIETTLRNEGEEMVPGEVETIHAALKDDESSRGLQQEVKGRLERVGVDVEALEKDLVSYQAIRTYLQKERNIEYEGGTQHPVPSAKDQIQRLKGRLRAVSEQRLDTLAKSGEITLGDHNVLVQVEVYCEDCGRQYSIEELLDDGGCNCSGNP